MERRVIVQWTTTAKDQLAELPRKVRRGLLDKANIVRDSDDPRKLGKVLVGPLQGYYRITYARYRAIYSVEEETLASGDALVKIYIRFVAVGQRKERDKKDVYAIAQKLVELGLIDIDVPNPDDPSEPAQPS
jgi:mRNA interferase RelE/StbE